MQTLESYSVKNDSFNTSTTTHFGEMMKPHMWQVNHALITWQSAILKLN